MREHLKAPRPTSSLDTSANVLWRNSPTTLLQRADNLNGKRRISWLVLAQKCCMQILVFAVRERANNLLAAILIGRKSGASCAQLQKVRLHNRRTHLSSGLCNNCSSFRVLRIAHHGRTPLDNSRFFSCYLRQRIAQKRSMVKTDARNSAHFRRVDDIRGVKTTAQTHFQNNNIAVATRKMAQRNSRHQLELRRMLTRFALDLFSFFLHVKRYFSQLIHRNKLAIHLDTLFERLNVRAREHTRRITSRLQDMRRINAGRTFAIRSCNVHELQLILRIFQLLHKKTRAIKPQVHRLPTRRVYVSNGIELFHEILQKRR